MATVTTTRPVSVAQLMAELGVASLHVAGAEPLSQAEKEIGAEVDAQTLAAAVAAHVPDPEWGISPTLLAERQEIAGLRVNAEALRDRAREVLAGGGTGVTFTPSQLQRIAAAVVLWILRTERDR